VSPNDRPSRDLIPAREIHPVGQRDPRAEPTELEQIRTDVRDLRTLIQGQARTMYRSQSPAAGMPAVIEASPHSSLGPRASTAERLLKLAGPKAWIVLLVIGSIVAIGVYSKELAALGISSSTSKDDHAAILKQAQEIDSLRQEVAALRASQIKIVEHQGRIQSDTSQVLSRLGAEWRMAGPNAPTPTLVEFETPIRTGNRVGKGPLFVVKTPMPVPPAVPSASP
jgi:hypothetical protein